MEYYAALRKKRILTQTSTWMTLEVDKPYTIPLL
jgi:hypothetical protein